MNRRLDVGGRARIAVVFAALLVMAAGCEEDAPCSDGLVLVGSSCRTAPVADAAPPATDVMAPAGAAFGATCADDAACGGDTNFCMKAPGAPSGYCTRTGCNSMPAICPMGWTCFNLGMFAPGLPHACSRP
jgi:hypothetical protein